MEELKAYDTADILKEAIERLKDYTRVENDEIVEIYGKVIDGIYRMMYEQDLLY